MRPPLDEDNLKAKGIEEGCNPKSGGGKPRRIFAPAYTLQLLASGQNGRICLPTTTRRHVPAARRGGGYSPWSHLHVSDRFFRLLIATRLANYGSRREIVASAMRHLKPRVIWERASGSQGLRQENEEAPRSCTGEGQLNLVLCEQVFFLRKLTTIVFLKCCTPPSHCVHNCAIVVSIFQSCSVVWQLVLHQERLSSARPG